MGNGGGITAKKNLHEQDCSSNITTKMIVEQMQKNVQADKKLSEPEITNDSLKQFVNLYADIEKKVAKHNKRVQQLKQTLIKKNAVNFNEKYFVEKNYSTYVADKIFPEQLEIKIQPKNKTQEEIEIETINKIKDNTQKIIQFNKKHAKDNYIIVDKQKCTATVYAPDGIVLKQVPVGLGKQWGDKMNAAILNGKWNEKGAYTTPGQFLLKKVKRTTQNIRAYKSAISDNLNIYVLNGIQHEPEYKEKITLAIHQIPNYRKAEREHLIEDDKTDADISNNRMSYGCINVLGSDFEDLNDYINAGMTLYILPEEKNNSLELYKNPKGKLSFKVKYANEQDNRTAYQAEVLYYKVDTKKKLMNFLKNR